MRRFWIIAALVCPVAHAHIMYESKICMTGYQEVAPAKANEVAPPPQPSPHVDTTDWLGPRFPHDAYVENFYGRMIYCRSILKKYPLEAENCFKFLIRDLESIEKLGSADASMKSLHKALQGMGVTSETKPSMLENLYELVAKSQDAHANNLIANVEDAFKQYSQKQGSLEEVFDSLQVPGHKLHPKYSELKLKYLEEALKAQDFVAAKKFLNLPETGFDDALAAMDHMQKIFLRISKAESEVLEAKVLKFLANDDHDGAGELLSEIRGTGEAFGANSGAVLLNMKDAQVEPQLAAARRLKLLSARLKARHAIEIEEQLSKFEIGRELSESRFEEVAQFMFTTWHPEHLSADHYKKLAPRMAALTSDTYVRIYEPMVSKVEKAILARNTAHTAQQIADAEKKIQDLQEELEPVRVIWQKTRDPRELFKSGDFKKLVSAETSETIERIRTRMDNFLNGVWRSSD